MDDDHIQHVDFAQVRDLSRKLAQQRRDMARLGEVTAVGHSSA